jgi:hypothetical protein
MQKKIISQMQFSNHLPWMTIICHRWIASATDDSIHLPQMNSKMDFFGCGVNIPAAFLQAMVDESPNKHLSLVPAQKNTCIFFLSALKLANIGTLRAFGGQNSGPKNFKWAWGLSYV